jgi:hypothetical protein
MSEYKFPELPSDDELGITDADREEYEKDLPKDGPELSAAEMAALLGDSPVPRPKAPSSKAKPTWRERRAAAKADKKRERAAKDAAAAVTRARNDTTTAAQSKGASTPSGAPASGRTSGESPVGGDAKSKAGARAATPNAPVTPGAPAAVVARGRVRGPLTLAVLLLTAVFASSRTGLPRPGAANAPDTEFSSARAMGLLVDVARQAHPTGSPEHTRVRELLVDRLTAMGLEPEIQTATSIVQRPGAARAATVRNIIARMPGTAPTGTVLVTAHYDSREIAVGAADDGSGVVAILEALRAVRAAGQLRNDVIVLITDAEELGLLGARAFVDQDTLMAEVDLALSFEMRGAGGPSIMFETNENNGWVIRALQEWDDHPFANSMAYEIYRRMPNDTDFTPFREAGVQGLNFAAIDRAHVYHQAADRPENVSEATLQHHGLHALGALTYFGNADLASVNADNVVYFSVPGLGLVVYDQRWVLWLSGALVLLFAVICVGARGRGVKLAGAAGGLVVSLLAMGISYGVAVAMMTWLPGRHPEVGALHGSAFHSEGWYLLALAFTVLAVVAAVSTVGRRWLTLLDIAIGAVVVPLVGAVALGFATPLAAMDVQWPVLSALGAVLVLVALGPRAEGVVGWLVSLLFALPVVIMFEPLVELIWLAMSIRLAGVLAVIAVLGLALCTPALAALRHPNGWWAPLTALGLAGVALGLGVLTSRPSPDRPSPSTLVYAYEHGSGNALWATSPSDDMTTAPAAWASERSGSAFAETRDLTDFGYRSGQIPVAQAPVVSAAPPAVVVVSDSLVQGRRIAVLRVHSQIGAETMQFHLDDGVELRSINGRTLTDSGSLRVVDYWGIPEGDVELELAMPAGRPIGVHIVEHLLRPWELPGLDRFTRPATLAPNVNWMSDRAMLRYSVAAFADPQFSFIATDSTEGGAAAVGAPAAVPDTSGVVPTPSRPDSAVVRPDTTRTQPDTTPARPDTAGALPETTHFDAMGIRQGTGAC